MIEILGISIGILGLVATLLSLRFAYVMFINPFRRFKKYLMDKNNWSFTSSRFNESYEYWQYTKHPEFTIELKEDGKWDREEPWIKKIPRPDPNLHLYEVALKTNGIVVHNEKFLAMDGWRYFVPIPRVTYASTDDEGDNKYYYDDTQELISRVIGKYHNDTSLESFCEHSRIKLGK